VKSKKLSRYSLVAAALLFGAVNANAASPTMDKIKSTGAVTMGVRESSIPMSYTTGDSRFDGYHVEVCRMILGDIKDKLGMSTLRINYQPVTSQNRVPLVQNGTVDIECGTTTNNASRAKDVGFANTLYVEEVVLLLKQTQASIPFHSWLAKKWQLLLVLRQYSCCASMRKPMALTLMKYLVRTMLTASCCSSLVVLMPL